MTVLVASLRSERVKLLYDDLRESTTRFILLEGAADGEL